MKNFSKGLFLLAAAASVGLASCSDESPWSGSESEGGINLEFSSDARVMRQTRADDSVSPVVPDGNQFAVNLQKSDGSYSKDWNSVEAFNRESSFPMGDYTLTASYGSIDEEGFSNPYYLGQTEVHVSPGAVTDARVVATLANAMVSIRYTDAFKENFAAYSSSIQTEGHQWVVFAQEETRPAYVAPSDVKINLTLTNSDGKVVHIEPASFVALARHHYVVTIGVTQNSTNGDMALDIQFDDDVVAETVNVSLGDDLFNAPEPSVKTKGFESGTAVEAFEYASYKNQAQFDVVAFGGLKTATLNIISSNGFVPSFGRSVQLVNASEVTQAQLKAAGVDCAGFFRNVGKMGVVDMRNFISKLPVGNYTVELQVVDAMTRTTEPIGMSVVINPVELELSSVANPDFLATELSVDVASNCEDIKNDISFKVPNANNQLVDAKIKSVTAISAAAGKATRADLPYKYRYVLEVEKITRSTLNIEANLGKRTLKSTVVVNEPQFTVTSDAFARKVVFRVDADSEESKKYICDNLVFYNGETPVPTANVSQTAGGFFTITGLQPSTTYSSMNCRLDTFRKDIAEFTTEAETDVANGNFTSLRNDINIQGITAGGQYKYLMTSYWNHSNIVADVPEGWATINSKTCYDGSQNRNTWFMVPSTMASSGEVLLRSVAYDHNGTNPPLDNHGVSIRDKYSRNAPASFSSYAAGELFLGTYSYTASGENRVDGVQFSSRPSSLSFQYRYEPVNNELAEMTVSVLDSKGAVLASGSLELSASSSNQTKTVALTYSSANFGKKAATLRVGFKSSNRTNVAAPVPSDLNDVNTTFPRSDGYDISTNQYKSLCVGSKLWVSNVHLGYGVSNAARSKATRSKAAKRR